MTTTMPYTFATQPAGNVPASYLDSNFQAALGVDGSGMLNNWTFRNRIINGDMRVAQRGSGISSGVSTNTYTLDRWIVYATGAAVTVSQYSGATFQTAGTAIQIAGAASNTLVNVVQRIEAQNVRDLLGQTITVSFWCYQSTGSTKSISVALQYPTATDNWTGLTAGASATFSVPTSSWTYCTVQLAVTTNAQYGIAILLGGIAVVATQGMYFGNVQLEVGSVATPFEQRPIGTELALCQRYYWQTDPAISVLTSAYWSTTTGYGFATYPVSTRTSPTVTFSSGYAASVVPGGTAATLTVTVPQTTGVMITATGTFIAGGGILRFTVGVMQVSAEL